MLTRRATQRQFLLRPDRETNNIFLYVLAVAAARFGIVVLLPFVGSNHHHLVLHDPTGKVIEFVEHLTKLVARAQNALCGRWENLWASEPPCLVRLIDVEDVLDKLVYASTNPVKDGLVERVHHWPGGNGLSDLLNRRRITVPRPRHFFVEGGCMAEEATLELTLPDELGDGDELRRLLRERVAAVEAAAADERRQTGRTVLGRRAILAQSWRDSPSSHDPRRNLRPRLAARNKAARIDALQRDRAFLIACRAARTAWLAGQPTAFPPGTYWLRRFARVPIAAAA